MERLNELGLKILVLSDMFKINDWEGISEVLNAVNTDIKRDALAKYPALINEKRNRIAKNQEETEFQIKSIEFKQSLIETKISETEQNYADMKASLALLNDYPKHIIEFLTEHIGLASGKPCLNKRVHQGWHKKLQKDGLIVYDKSVYIYITCLI